MEYSVYDIYLPLRQAIYIFSYSLENTDTEVYCIALGPYGKYDHYIHVF